MLGLSLLFHVTAFTPFFLHSHGSRMGASVPFIDLDLSMDSRSAPPPHPLDSGERGKKETPATSLRGDAPPSELDRLRENAQRSVADAAVQPDAVDGASLGLSITSGYFASIGEGETLRDDIREYYFEMLRRINQKWWVNGDNQLTGRNRAIFYLVIARNGSIVDRKMVESSGNPAYDKAMLRTLEASSPLPPLPESYRGDFFQAPLRFNAPLNLLHPAQATSS